MQLTFEKEENTESYEVITEAVVRDNEYDAKSLNDALKHE